MKSITAFVLMMALTFTASAREPMKMSALSVFMNNLNTLEWVPSESRTHSSTVATGVAKALSSGTVNVQTHCEYIGRSLREACTLTIMAGGEGRGKSYIFKFERFKSDMINKTVSLNIAL